MIFSVIFFPYLPGFWKVCRFTPRLFFKTFFSADQLPHTNFTFQARISPQWLSELRRLRPTASWRVASELVFPDTFPHYAWTAQSAYSDFFGSRVYACLGVTCHLHFWQTDRGLFTCHCGNMGVDRTPINSQHRNLTPEKKILPTAPAGIGTRNLSITSPALSRQAIPDIFSK